VRFLTVFETPSDTLYLQEKPVESTGAAREGSDMQDIFWGGVIIGIGLLMGGSVFQGDFSILSILFDGLGVFFVGRGVLTLVRRRSS
jgi:hypothetical protein